MISAKVLKCVTMVVTFCQICDMHSIVLFHISALHTSDTI